MSGSDGVAPVRTPGDADNLGYVKITADGKLRKKMVKSGPEGGAKVVAGCQATVHYSGYIWPEGPIFDSSYTRNMPLKFKVGEGDVIKGWDMGLIGMSVGDHAELICEHEYGYGKVGNPPAIKPYATLVFEIEIVQVDTPQDPVQEKLTDAKALKEQGNAEFKAQRYESAIQMYQRALDRLSYTWGADPTEATECVALRLALNLNLAAAALKEGNLRVAVSACETAIAIDTKSVKAYYRLGQALKGLNRWKEAMEALQTAEKLDDKDPLIKEEIVKVAEAEKAANQAEKNLYKRMFAK
ncbi:cytochrome P450 monooxygenase 9 [Irineochytrium annulatum]|nr:cytochrome P450 monooxygenase 9 [Irineochytrium annulatum]